MNDIRVYGVESMYLPMLDKQNIDEFKQKVKKRKIIIWGAKDRGIKLTNILSKHDLFPDLFVDNDVDLHGRSLFGVEIKKTSFIYELDEKPFIFIAITHFSAEIIKQLNSKGFTANRDYHYYYQKVQEVIVENVEDFSEIIGNTILGNPTMINSKIIFHGFNNTLTFKENVILENTTIRFNENGVCSIGANSRFKGYISVGKGCKVDIGANLTVTNNCTVTAAEYTDIIIGNDCMFATNNQIRSHDHHPIFDVRTGKRINLSKSIKIGNHVWLAIGAVVLPGAQIGEGSVVGHSSIVKSTIPNNCIAAGVPARIVKRNVAWDRVNFSFMSPYYFPDGDYILDKKYWNETEEK